MEHLWLFCAFVATPPLLRIFIHHQIGPSTERCKTYEFIILHDLISHRRQPIILFLFLSPFVPSPPHRPIRFYRLNIYVGTYLTFCGTSLFPGTQEYNNNNRFRKGMPDRDGVLHAQKDPAGRPISNQLVGYLGSSNFIRI